MSGPYEHDIEVRFAEVIQQVVARAASPPGGLVEASAALKVPAKTGASGT
jgi:hypothetical protein